MRDLALLHDKHMNRPTLDDSSEEEHAIEITTQEITQVLLFTAIPLWISFGLKYNSPFLSNFNTRFHQCSDEEWNQQLAYRSNIPTINYVVQFYR